MFVGERTSLSAVFTSGEATIDGLGPVQSGTPVMTPPLARTTTFVLRLRRGAYEILARATVEARYRGRFRALAGAPIGRGTHLAGSLPSRPRSVRTCRSLR